MHKILKEIINNFRKTSGFSLMEMLVSIAIVALIMAVVVLNQGDFTDSFNLSTNINDLELQIRQEQVFGISVKEFENEFSSAYGVSLSTFSEEEKLFYIVFADRTISGSKNGIYDSGSSCVVGGSSECIKSNPLTRGVKINKICALNEVNPTTCSEIVGRADITFNRPYPNAKISFFDSSGLLITVSNAVGVQIELISPQGKLKSVKVYTSGQLSIS